MKTLLNFFIFGSIRAQNLSPDDCKVSASCFSTIKEWELNLKYIQFLIYSDSISLVD